MELAEWLLRQIVANGGSIHRDGIEEPIGTEELEGELGRRLEGLTIRPRLTVSANPPIEALPPRKDWWLRFLDPRGSPTVKAKVFGWFFNLPESMRRLTQTKLSKEYKKASLPGSVSSVTTAIAEAKKIDKRIAKEIDEGAPENRY
jgi:hypothetical protein